MKEKTGIGIYAHGLEITQEDVDMWCGLCRFPIEGKRCKDKETIKACWGKSPNAHQWHLQHECPFAQKGQVCHCNDYKSFEDAFKAVGLKYKPSLKELKK
jgi:hypothetical protein